MAFKETLLALKRIKGPDKKGRVVCRRDRYISVVYNHLRDASVVANQVFTLDPRPVPQTEPFVHATRQDSSIRQKCASRNPISMAELLAIQNFGPFASLAAVQVQSVVRAARDHGVALDVHAEDLPVVLGF